MVMISCSVKSELMSLDVRISNMLLTSHDAAKLTFYVFPQTYCDIEITSSSIQQTSWAKMFFRI